VLELEDGVALTMKTQARNNAVKWLTKEQQRPTHCEYGLRVNSIASRLIDDDFNVRIGCVIQIAKVFVAGDSKRSEVK
jgi:citrate lyase beta subunit